MISDPWTDETHVGWLRLGKQLADLVNETSERKDLLVQINPKTVYNQTAAWYIPSQASIFFNPAQVFGNDQPHPNMIDLWDPVDRAKYIDLLGAAVHESAHAAHTVLAFNNKKHNNREAIDWAVLLEESRCERYALLRRPQDIHFLRATIFNIVAGGKMNHLPQDSFRQAVHSAVLLLARVDAGTLYSDEVATLREKIVNVIGEDVLNELRKVWQKSLYLADGDIDGLYACGVRIHELFQENQPESEKQAEREAAQKAARGAGSNGPGTPGGSGGGQSGEGSEDGESGEGDAYQMPCGAWTEGEISDERAFGAGSEDGEDSEDGGGEIAEAAKDAAREAAEDAKNAVDATVPNTEPNAKKAAEAREEKKARNRAQKAANRVFRGSPSAGRGATPVPINARMEAPSARDTAAANKLTKELRKAQHRDVARTRIASQTPPGRMRVNQAANRAAQVAAGVEVTATPWVQTRRRMVTAPPLTVGISVDISGSMDAYQRPVSSFAWALGKAVRNLDGTVGAVAWNSTAQVIAHPGRVSRQIPVMKCQGGSGGLSESLDALDGQLDLVRTEGVRVQVILTDGQIHYGGVYERLNRLIRAGVIVVWVHTPFSYWGQSSGYKEQLNSIAESLPAKGIHYTVLENPNDFGTQIGKFIADKLSKYGRAE